MRTLKIVMVCFVLSLGLVNGMEAYAESTSGPRIPTDYIATTGTGESDDGILPDPYETFSYDLALLEAGIENFNVVYYTSVLPPESREVALSKTKKYFHHGAVLETIMAKAGGLKGDTVAAGLGRVWAINDKGDKIGGFAAEYERVYKGEIVNADQAKEDAVEQLTKSLNHELSIRGLKQDGEMKFSITSLRIKKKYGIALSALGFLNFIYPDAVKVE